MNVDNNGLQHCLSGRRTFKGVRIPTVSDFTYGCIPAYGMQRDIRSDSMQSIMREEIRPVSCTGNEKTVGGRYGGLQCVARRISLTFSSEI